MNRSNPALRLPAWRKGLADYPATSHFADIDGCAMHYLDEGNRDAEPVLMVHGNPTWSYYWRRLVSGLTPTHRAIAIDHIGCGLSEKPDKPAYSLDLRIKHLVELIQKLDLHRINLVVHDWGGAIGIGAALEERSRFRRVILLNTAAFPPPFFPLRIRACRMPVFGQLAVQGMNVFARAAIRMATEQRGGLPGDVAQNMLAPYDSWQNRRAIYEFVTDIPTRADQPTMKRLVAIKEGLEQFRDEQILMLWGMRDWCFRPECLRKFQEVWPNARTCEYANAGHYLMEDAREEIIDEVKNFLVT